MSNVLEYTLSLQDKFSAKLRIIGVNSDTALEKFAALQKKANAFSRETQGLGKNLTTLKSKLDLLQQERDLIPTSSFSAIRRYNSEIKSLEKEIQRFQTINGNPIKSMFRNAVSSIPFANFFTNPLVLGGAIAAKSFRAGFQNNMASVAFETLLGSQDAAKKMVGDIRQYANTTPYENMPMQENAKMMLALNVAQEKIMPNLKMLGDIAMGDKNKMDALTLAFSQSSSAGKLTGQDLLQMINAGFNPLQEISKKTGKSMSQLRKEMEKGNISFSMVEGAFKSATSEGGRFYKMTEKMGQAPMGKWSTFIDGLKNNLLTLYEVMQPLIIPAIELLTWASSGLSSALQWIVGLFKKFKTMLQEGNPVIIAVTSLIVGLTAVVVGYNAWMGISTVATKLWHFAQNGLNTAFWTSPITWIIVGIIALIAAIAFVIYKTDGWGATWKNLMSFMDLSWKIFKNQFHFNWLLMQDSFLTGIELIEKAWYKLQSLWDKEGAKAGLEKIESHQNERADEIAKARGLTAELQAQRDKIKVWQVKWNDNKLSDISGKLKQSLGIAAPTIPGTNGATGTEGGDATSKAGGVTDKIASGGTRNTSIYVTLKNLVEQIIFQGGLSENKESLKEQLQELLMQTLYSVKETA